MVRKGPELEASDFSETADPKLPRQCVLALAGRTRFRVMMWRRWSVLAGFCVALAEGAGRLSIFFGWTPMLELDGKVDLVSNESFQLGVSSTLDPYNDLSLIHI